MKTLSIAAQCWLLIALNSLSLGQESVTTISPPDSPPYRGLDASLYMQTSAEYRAVCLQTFRWAARLAEEQQTRLGATTKPLAVVMDLDETIFDNGVFQAEQMRAKRAFDIRQWSLWEDGGADQVRLIPGAKRFIDRLRELDIAPVYITNRDERAKAQTMSALTRLGVAVPGDQLHCANEETGSNKTSRRKAVTDRFEVIVYVGDNLRDFDEAFRYDSELGPDGRFTTVDEHDSMFGTQWVILPNPAYGEWNKVARGSAADADRLHQAK